MIKYILIAIATLALTGCPEQPDAEPDSVVVDDAKNPVGAPPTNPQDSDKRPPVNAPPEGRGKK